MKTLVLCCICLASLFTVTPALPHHAFASEFDINKPVSLSGAVTKMEWTNPHAWLFMEARDDAGNVSSWSIELVGINDLMRLGWGRDKVKVGDVISVVGYSARNGTNTANAASVSVAGTGELLWESVARSGREAQQRTQP